MQERTTYYEIEIREAIQQLEQQFLEFDSSPENLSAENLATIVANVIAKKAAVTLVPLSVIKWKKYTILQNSSTNGSMLV